MVPIMSSIVPISWPFSIRFWEKLDFPFPCLKSRWCSWKWVLNNKFPNTSPSSQITKKKAQIACAKDEIKFLRIKKDKLILDLYNIHLKAPPKWGRSWDILLLYINNTLNLEMEKKYKQLDLKINRLFTNQTEKSNSKTQLYPSVINKTDITFTDEEMTLLNKGLKYNLRYRKKT